MSCELCKLGRGNIITHKYYEDDKWILVDCKTCNVPMLVYKEHMFDPQDESTKNIVKFFEDNVEVDNHRNYYIDFRMRQIPEHFHCHYRRREI